VNLNDIQSIIQNLSLADKESLVSRTLKDLPTEAKSRVIEEQLGRSGLVVVIKSSDLDLATQIQEDEGVNLAAVLDAVVQRRKSDRAKRSR
jgi:hypothetical protein